MKRSIFLLLAAVLCVALTACGGAGPAKNTKLGSTANQLSRCTAQDTTMGCQLAERHQSPSLGLRLPTGQGAYRARGIDFAWSCPDPHGTFGGAGADFAISYLSPDGSKNWSRGCITWWVGSGKKVGTVYESSAGEAGAGYRAGQDDANLAGQQAQYLGEPRGRAIFFAIDFDAGCSQTFSYFDGVNSQLGRYGYATGAYGGITPVRCLFNAGKIRFGWQAYAWSFSAWDGRAQVEQWLNGDAWDYDRTLGGDPGLWPWQTGPSGSDYRRWRGARDASLRVYRRHRCRQPVLTTSGCGLLAWRVDHFQVLVDQQGQGPRCFGSRARRGAPACQIVRPAVAVWSRASVSSHRWHNRAQERYFDGRINKTLATSRL